jgi:[pyruvate, water dikinase]-phosphate phosphotransferase / [pyruvate, water dikinase] kinase
MANKTVGHGDGIGTGPAIHKKTPVLHRMLGKMKQYHLHLVSDATGDTIAAVARACTIQFDQVDVVTHKWNLVRNDRQMGRVLDSIRENPGMVMFTIVEEGMRHRLQDFCKETQLPCIPVLDPLIAALGAYLDAPSQSKPGRQHTLDAEYFSRMDAMEWTLVHDDGQMYWDLHEADVVLVGVSRTSKTPTCFYLANRGIKAANVPFVPGVPLPEELFKLTTPLIVGLTKDAEGLIEIRRTRLKMMTDEEETNYVDPDFVRREITEARRVFTQHRWPVISVTRRSIEETAAEIVMLLNRKRGEASKKENVS